MQAVNKYDNLTETFPKLRTVLRDALQNEFLDIKRLRSDCQHYEDVCCDHPLIKDAICVIYSPFMKKSDHDYETFIFINIEGEETCHISGREMDLDGILESVQCLKKSEEYIRSNVSA